MTTNNPPTLADADRDLISRCLGLSEYNPYRYWLIGHPNEQRKLSVFQIKADDNRAICACPELGLCIRGTDYLETQNQLQRAILAELGKPIDTVVAVTCAPRFDLDGQKLMPQSQPDPSDAPDNPPATTSPEQHPPEATHSAHQAAAPETDQATNLFDRVDEYLDTPDAQDPNDTDQLGLF